LLLGVSGGFSAVWLVTRWRVAVPSLRLPREATLGLIALCLLAALLYPVGATLSRTEGLGRDGRTLDGTLHRRIEEPDQYEAVDWLRQRAQPGQRMVEANGDSYSSGSLISGASAVPTVLGWYGHELQWGRDGRTLSQRRSDINFVYTTTSLEDALTILRKYGVTYVYVGPGYEAAFREAAEKNGQTYSPRALQKFETGLPAVYKSGGVSIYRVPPEEPGQ
jgi:uncharacterized membrane protein